jgi:hypothetical protein
LAQEGRLNIEPVRSLHLFTVSSLPSQLPPCSFKSIIHELRPYFACSTGLGFGDSKARRGSLLYFWFHVLSESLVPESQGCCQNRV